MEQFQRLKTYIKYGREAAAAGDLPLLKQWREIALLLILGGNGPGYYYMAGMADRKLFWRDKKAHLSPKAWRKAIRKLNNEQYFKLSQHKLSEKSILTVAGIPTPKFLGYFHDRAGRTISNDPLRSLPDWMRFLTMVCGKRFCVKLAEGFGGTGFRAYHVGHDISSPELRSLDGRKVDPEAVYDEMLAAMRDSGSGLIIEEYLEQHHVLQTLSRSSVNSVRIWVVIDQDGDAHFPLAFLRMGRGNSLVDNRSAGGLVAPIDVATGILSIAFDGTPRRTEYRTHPDTGANISNVQLPFWPEVLNITERAIRVFPGIRFAGIDVAFAEYGPIILELNVEPERTGAAITGVPSGIALGLLATDHARR